MVVLFILKAYKKPWIIWMLFFLSCAVAAANNQQEPTWRITNLFPAFFSGNLVYLYRDLIGKIPWKLAVAVIIIESFINKAFGFQPQAWYMVPLCSFSALILCINAPSLPRLKVDLSYGLYVYHDPIYSWASKVAPYSFSTIFLTGSTVLLGVTLISWYLIEKPALTLKNWFYLK
jgi:peptidoglycan/LPS O-acetylase OafA/YrhL